MYDVLSPDGFSIAYGTTYRTKKAAREAFQNWLKRYKRQGYYSYRMERIPLAEVHEYCRLVKL